MTTTIWHNPRCSKSRQTLALLQERGVSPTIRLYLEDGPTKAEIADVLRMLGAGPRALLRSGEEVYRSLGLGDAKKSDAALIAAMAEHPILIERPVVIRSGKAAIGRPPEKVIEIL